MWDNLLKLLAGFSSGVLTGVDASGYPYSMRCRPEPDAAAQGLRLKVPDYAGIQPGPAGLLCHQHDELLWNLKSFVVRGSLERDAQGWLFRPRQLIPGAGMGGLMGFLNFVRTARRTTKQYLANRRLARPGIPWARIKEIWAEIHRASRAGG